MDDLNMFHILTPTIEDLKNGVRVCSQDDVASKTLVCFLDKKEAFHFGFGYKNGSTFRVVCWEKNIRKNKTVTKGALIIAFDQKITRNSFDDNFTADDFGFTATWFNNDAQKNVRDELRALNDKQDIIADLIERIAGLTIDELAKVNQKIDELPGNN